jgi:hypothetical protein
MITLDNDSGRAARAAAAHFSPTHKGPPSMRDIAQEVYGKMKIGSVAWIRPVPAKGDTLDSFQAAHAGAQTLADEGLINIEKVQRQADGLIDAIRILRLA